jgi:NUDIX domain
LQCPPLTTLIVLVFSPWGEHEIDYVLFFCLKSKDELTITPHPDEVDAVKWVTRQQLIDMMGDPKLLFSPWFRLICKKWLLDFWWKDLKATMTTDKYCDYVKIHCFDPPIGRTNIVPYMTILCHSFVVFG